MMNRREFAKSAATGAALSALAAIPAAGALAAGLPANAASGDPGLIGLCRDILKQNLLKEGERMVVATGYSFPENYVAAMLEAGTELGAVPMHVRIFPRSGPNGRNISTLGMGHWQLYADTDLLIVPGFGNTVGVPGGTSGYGGKVGNHPYPTDRAYIHRPGSRTRWLEIGYHPPMQRTLFSNAARRARAIAGAEIMHGANEVRIESKAGTKWRCNKRGFQGHSQYGIADVPGRWDVYGTGCVASASVKADAEGVMVFEPGDILLELTPQMVPVGEQLRVTWRGGEIVQVDGTRMARHWDQLLSSYGHPDSKRVSHVGFGIHEGTRRMRYRAGERDVTGEQLYSYHHNDSGSILFALGTNCGHGGGGKELNYSGLGMNADACGPNHTHFSFHGDVNMWCDNTQVVANGELVPQIARAT